MEIIFSAKAQKDRSYWKKSGNKSVMNKISALIKEIQLHPFQGIGKPEPLKHELSGKWSRRINKEHKNNLSNYRLKQHRNLEYSVSKSTL